MGKYKITKIYTTNKDKQGNQLMANGRPYTRMSIKVAEYGEKWISGFSNAVSKTWKEGDVVDVEIKQNGEYLNFETPKKEDISAKLNDKIELILTKLGKIELLIRNNGEINVPTPAGVHYPTPEEEGIDFEKMSF